jgi:hypothetical protein
MEPNPVTAAEARSALDAVGRERRRVLDEVGLPAWYWWGPAVGWVVLGVIADVGPSWLTTVATIVFGAVHSSVAPAHPVTITSVFVAVVILLGGPQALARQTRA